LGPGAIRVHGEALALPTKRSLAILALVALEGRLNRQRLAYTLWNEEFVDDPRRNLRQELYRLTKLGLEGLVVQDGEWVSAEGVRTDLSEVEAAVTRGEWRAVLAHSGELLERFSLRDAPEFEAWLESRRAHLRGLRAAALEGLGTELEAARDWAGALEVRLHAVNLDPWSERDHRAIVRLHAEAGHVERAVAHFETFKQRLRAELGVEPLPETVALMESVRADLAARGPAAALEPGNAALAAAALLGDAFSWAELRGVTELDDEALSGALDAALEAGTIRAVDSERYAFSDPDTRAGLASALKPGRRRLLHARLARTLERLGAAAERIAAQLEGAGEADHAARAYLRAATLERRAHRHDEAARLADRAAALFSAPQERLNALRFTVHVEDLRARLQEREVRVARMEDLAEQSGVGLPLAVLERARLLLDSAQYPKALENAQDLLSDGLLEGADVAVARFVVGAALFRLGRLSEAAESFQYVLKHARKLSTERLGAAYHLAMLAFLEKRFKDIDAPLALAERIAEELRSGVYRANNAVLRAMVADSLERKSDALEHTERALEIAVSGGLPLQQQAALQVRSSVLLSLGRLDEALATTTALLALPANPYMLSVHRMTLGNIQIQRGELGAALALFEGAIESADALQISPQMAMRRVIVAEFRTWCGDFSGARVHGERAKEIAQPLNLSAALERAELSLGLCALHGARLEDALAHLTGVAFAEPDLEIERLIAVAQTQRALGITQPPSSSTDLTSAPRVQRIRWQLETADLGPVELDSIARELLETHYTTLEALEARKALLRRHDHPELRAFHSSQVTRLALSLPPEMRAGFERFHRLEP
jgi:DNA-binding SARP family transcriptional activator